MQTWLDGGHDLETCLWQDDRPYQARYEKAATALIAVARHLDSSGSDDPAVVAFLESYDWLGERDPEVMGEVWTSPLAYAWARELFETLSRDGMGSESVARLMAGIGRFVVGAAMLDGSKVSLGTPMPLAAETAIPGTPWVVLADEGMRLCGAKNGWPLVASPDGTVSLLDDLSVGRKTAPRLRRCVEYRGSGCNILIDAEPARLSELSVPAFETAGRAGAEFQNEKASMVVHAMTLIEAHEPVSFDQMRRFAKVIALKVYDLNDFLNVTHSDLPGAFVATPMDDPYYLADKFIHEFHHNRLFFLEEPASFFEEGGDGSHAEEGFYSPWRQDLRPLRGLLHAIYVHVPVTRFWMSVYSSNQVEPIYKEMALDHLIRHPLQFEMGMKVMDDHAVLSPAGKLLVTGLKESIAKLQAELAELDLPADAQAYRDPPDPEDLYGKACDRDGNLLTVRDTLKIHREVCDTRRQVADYPL